MLKEEKNVGPKILQHFVKNVDEKFLEMLMKKCCNIFKKY
jgi:hypothetical protein